MMKTSIAITVLILVAGGLVGWKQSAVYAKAMEVHREVRAEFEALGVSAEGAEAVAAETKLSERERERKEQEARAFAKDLIAFAKKMKEMEASGERPDMELQKEIMGLIGKLLDLDGAQLKVLIGEIRETPELEDQSRREILGFAIMMMAQDHPETALAMFTESSDLLDTQGMGPHVISMALTRLASEDPVAAMEWIRNNGEKHPELVTDRTKSGVLNGIALRDPALAVSFLDDLDMGEGSGSAAFALSRGAKTPEQRQALLEALRKRGDKDLSRSALGQMASQVAGQGFEAATKWYGEAGLSEEERKWVASGIGMNEMSGDTAQWIEWIGEELGDERGDSVGNLVRRWTEQDYRAAGEWLAGAEEGPTKRAAVKSYAETVAPYDADAAAQWARTLPEGKERHELSERIYEEWKKKDEEAAQRFAGEEGLEVD